MSQPANTPSPTGEREPTDHDAQPDRTEPHRTEVAERGGEPDPLDALRAEFATIDQQPVVDRVARFEHANVVLAAALAELDEV